MTSSQPNSCRARSGQGRQELVSCRVGHALSNALRLQRFKHGPTATRLVLADELAAQVGEAAGALVAHVKVGIRDERHLEQHACRRGSECKGEAELRDVCAGTAAAQPAQALASHRPTPSCG